MFTMKEYEKHDGEEPFVVFPYRNTKPEPRHRIPVKFNLERLYCEYVVSPVEIFQNTVKLIPWPETTAVRGGS